MDELQKAVRYLLPRFPAYRIWRWGDSGDVIEWCSGGTIAFRDQVRRALTRIEGGILPPIELIVLVLAATRDSWPEDREQLTENERYRGDVPDAEWRATLQSLDHIHRLPQQMRRSADDVAAIMDFLFEGQSLEDMEAEPVLKLLAQPKWMNEVAGVSTSSVSVMVRCTQLNWLTRRAGQLTIERLLNRMSTGLDELPKESDEQALEPESGERSVSQLLEELRDDNDYAGLVQLVRQLSAVLTLPRRLSESDELPQGGVSDLTNRGTPDQLLLSELAHDEMTLTARIALNEALYLRRETPPANPVHERTLLIDVGIRTWGLPRLMAAAVALSLARAERGMSVRVFHTAPDRLAPVDLTTRAGLTEHLKTLDHQLHPGARLEAWQQATAAENVQRVLITEDSVTEDADFRRTFEQLDLVPCFVICVNRTGRVRLFVRTPAGEKLQREIQLDVDQVSGADRADIDSLIDPSIDPRLPALMRLKRMPLRLPYELREVDSLVPFPAAAEGTVDALQVTRDRRLLLWDAAQGGGRQLTDRLPQGHVRWSGRLSDDGSISLLIGGAQPPELFHVRVHADRQTVSIVPLGTPKSPNGSTRISGFACEMGVVLLIFRRSVSAVDPVTAEVLDAVEIPKDYQWVRSRYLREGSRWHVVSYSGGRLTFELLVEPPMPAGLARSIGIVGSEERPLLVYSNGQAFDIVSRETLRITADYDWFRARIPYVSTDGSQFMVPVSRSPDEAERRSGRSTSVDVDLVVDVLPCAADERPQFHVRPMPRYADHRRVLAAGKTPLTVMPGNRAMFKKPARLCYGRRLMIMTTKGRRLCLAPQNQESPRRIMLRDVIPDDEPYQDSADFTEIPTPKGTGIRLRQVTWADGSRAVLDSRGLLHLQSSDSDIPELSLILTEPFVSGWCSEGGTWGLDYFIDTSAPEHRSLDPEHVMEIIDRFVRRLA